MNIEREDFFASRLPRVRGVAPGASYLSGFARQVAGVSVSEVVEVAGAARQMLRTRLEPCASEYGSSA